MEDNAGRFYMEDGVLKESVNLKDIKNHDGAMIYDVVRIIDGIPLFFEDHYARTCKTFQAIGNECSIEPYELKKQLYRIISANNNSNCNIKYIMFTVEGTPKMIGYISKSYYPSAEEISKGVPVGLYSLERENPNIKLIDNDYKKKINNIKSERGFYEVFLVDSEGNVNEGGTSNIFFIKKGKIYTAPEEKVLKGITRMHVIESCRAIGREVIETAISESRLGEAEAVFLSGTSPKVLPVSSIDDMRYESSRDPVVEAIRLDFDEKIDRYIAQNR